MKKFSSSEAELKKALLIEKSEYFVGNSKWSTLKVGVKAYLIYFLFRREFPVPFVWIVKR